MVLEVEVDARGLSCPLPVIRTKEAVEKNPDAEIVVLVDNPAAKENVIRMAEKTGRLVSVESDGLEFRLNLTKGVS
ncbi:MAG: sulfurtransferase TusA family protein [Actinomycetota bacterium]|nr:sulfurtransferase TusA family protein [Actinomycetota bacterium]